jgi:hypothetical protein
MQARRELIESQPVAFPFKVPGERERERQAQSLELRTDVPRSIPATRDTFAHGKRYGISASGRGHRTGNEQAAKR